MAKDKNPNNNATSNTASNSTSSKISNAGAKSKTSWLPGVDSQKVIHSKPMMFRENSSCKK